MDPNAIDPNAAQAAIGSFAVVGLIFAILWLVLVVVWIILPFAIFGIKPRLDRMIHEQKRTNELLSKLLEKP